MFSCVIFLSACQPVKTSQLPVFHASENPKQLSDWQTVNIVGNQLAPGADVVPYDLNTPLFSDYAHKYRTIWMPEGVSATYRDEETFDFPVGTVISKTFYYPRVEGVTADDDMVARTDDHSRDFIGSGLNLENVRLIETRILVHRETGWDALPYVWNDAQTDAVLKRIGDIKRLQLVAENGDRQSIPYVVPNANQCAGCHATNNTTRKILPIGPKARHMNKDFTYVDGVQNQLGKLEQVGYLDGVPDLVNVSKNAVWNDPKQSIDSRARAYLDANCSHCHSTVGPADTSGLHFEPETESGPHLGLCKVSVAAGGGTGGLPYDIVPGQPDQSILVYRMASSDPGEMMPELGRSIAHDEGVALMREWIAAMDGDCG